MSKIEETVSWEQKILLDLLAKHGAGDLDVLGFAGPEIEIAVIALCDKNGNPIIASRGGVQKAHLRVYQDYELDVADPRVRTLLDQVVGLVKKHNCHGVDYPWGVRSVSGKDLTPKIRKLFQNFMKVVGG